MMTNLSTQRRTLFILSVTVFALVMSIAAGCHTWLDTYSQLTAPMIDQVEDISGEIMERNLSTPATDTTPTVQIDGSNLTPQSVPGTALTMGTVAMDQLADNCVTSRKIKDGEVMSVDLAAASVTNEKIAPGAITADRLSPNVLAGIQGPKGDMGPQGPKGDRGDPGPPGASPFALNAINDAIFDGHNIGIGTGTTTPNSRLTVNGVIESTSGGFKFPNNGGTFDDFEDIAVGVGSLLAPNLPLNSICSLQICNDLTLEVLRLASTEGAVPENILLTAAGAHGAGEVVVRNGFTPNLDTVLINGYGDYNGGLIELRSGSNGSKRVQAFAGEGGNTPYGAFRLYNGAGQIRLNMESGYPNGNTGGSVSLYNKDGVPTASIDGGGTSGGASMTLGNNGGTPLIQLFADDPGVVGNDDSLVDIKGKLKARIVCGQSGSLTGGCDLAEVFEYSTPASVVPGMVMVIDPTNLGHLRVSASAYDKKVAGIVSGAGDLAPGLKLGQRADGSSDLPLALSGRVYCFVDATDSAVEIGDMLTTSDTAGHAMKATDRERAYGASIGKAMEPLAKGKTGLVLVLVALQ